nr:CRS2-associated factor 2, mitochondrial [Ipomoea batatas]
MESNILTELQIVPETPSILQEAFESGAGLVNDIGRCSVDALACDSDLAEMLYKRLKEAAYSERSIAFPYGVEDMMEQWASNAHSFLCFGMTNAAHSFFSFEGFQRLQVLDAYNMVNCFDSYNIAKQVNLRYLAISSNTLSKELFGLRNLQTLNVMIPYGYHLKLPTGIWDLTRLRHIHFKTGLLNRSSIIVDVEGQGKGGVTHNMLEDIHNHWKRAEAVRIKCYGVPTLDMDNVCFHLEVSYLDPSCHSPFQYDVFGSSFIFTDKDHSAFIGQIGPTIPLMLWKPYAPIYPKLVKNVADGLTFKETKEMRTRGLNSPPLTKLTRNGVYINVVEKVRVAFQTEELVRLDCSHVGTSDCKKISVKLRDLVPCIPILVKDEQVILWRGKRDEDQNSGSSTELAKF